MGRAPRVAATASYRLPAERKAPSRLTTRNGRATKVWASTTAVVENAIWIPATSRLLPRKPLPAERVEQGDPAHDRRQHERQEDEGAQQTLAGEVAAGQHERQRHPEEHAEHSAGGGGAKTQPQCRERRFGGDQREELGPVDPGHHGRERQQHEQGPDCGDRQNPPRNAAVGTDRSQVHAPGVPKPASVRIFWPSGPVTSAMNAAARSLFRLVPTAAMGYVFTAVPDLGEGDAPDLVAGGPDVRDVDQAGVGLPGTDLAQDVGDGGLLTNRFQGHAGFPFDRFGGRTARNLARADDHLHARPGEVRKRTDRRRIGRRHGDGEDVRGEVLRCAVDEPGILKLGHGAGIGRGEHVRGRTLAELRDQVR